MDKGTRTVRVEEQRTVERQLRPVEIHSIMDDAESKRENELTIKKMVRSNLEATRMNCYSDERRAKVDCTHYYQIHISSFSSVCI